jgi:hypothetical protein
MARYSWASQEDDRCVGVDALDARTAVRRSQVEKVDNSSLVSGDHGVVGRSRGEPARRMQ